jgi:hypothetical protein
MQRWKNESREILDKKQGKIGWCDVGNTLLESMFKSDPTLYEGYIMFNGLDTMYPCNWNQCVKEFLEKPYDNYKKIIRNFQPIIVLVNSVYKEYEKKGEEDISKMPLSYFIQTSLKK